MITAFEALITRILAPLPESLSGGTPRASGGANDAAPPSSPPRSAAPAGGYSSACCPSPLSKGIKAYRASQQRPLSPSTEGAGVHTIVSCYHKNPPFPWTLSNFADVTGH
jgi:hypothetical protein